MGKKPLFRDLFRNVSKSSVEPLIDDLEDGNSVDVLSPSVLDSEEREALRDIVDKLKPKINAENKEKMEAYWDFWEPYILEMQRANSHVLGKKQFSFDNLFLDESFMNLMKMRDLRKKVVICDIDNTVFSGNLTYVPDDTNALALINIGQKYGVFNDADNLFADYSAIGKVNSGNSAQEILNLNGIYDFAELKRLDVYFSKGFTEVYNLHREGNYDDYMMVKFCLLNEICKHPENSCLSPTYLQDILLIKKFCDKAVFITLSEDMITKVLFGLADMFVPENEQGNIVCIGSQFSVHKGWIDVNNKDMVNECVNLAFGPKKTWMLEKYFLSSDVSEKIRTINSVANHFSFDPTVISPDDIDMLECVYGLDVPVATVLYLDDKLIENVDVVFNTDNIEDPSGLLGLRENNKNIRRVTCNLIKNDQWIDAVEEYAQKNNIVLNRIDKATDFVTLEIFEQSIRTMLFDYGSDGIMDICKKAGRIKQKADICDGYGNVSSSGSFEDLQDIRNMFVSLKYDLQRKYTKNCEKCNGNKSTLFSHLLDLEIRNIDFRLKNSSSRKIGCEMLKSGIWDFDPACIGNIMKNDELYVLPLSQSINFDTSNNPAIKTVMDYIKNDVYGWSNNDLFSGIINMFVDQDDVYSFFTDIYLSHDDEMLKTIKKSSMLINEMFLPLS